jgi:membrane protein DedA with SNARE-associated domain
MNLNEFLAIYQEHFSYFGIFAIVALSGYLIPFPEEIVLLSLGYFTAAIHANIFAVITVAIIGILAGDSAIFYLSLSSNKYIDRLKRKIREPILKKYEQFLQNHAKKTIFASRFIIGLRFIGPVLAGSAKTSWSSFLVSDGAAAIIYTLFIVLLGFHFHNKILLLISEFELIRHLIFLTVVVLVGGGISIFLHKRFFTNDN